jgi:CRISPR/Cas system-associated exonuclease Cas4 (RecB family)
MTKTFDWTIRKTDWPPRAEVKPPFSLTRVEIARSCPLRVVFEVSRQYEPLLSFDARIGTAMHATLEHFAKFPPAGSAAPVMQQVEQQFLRDLEEQRQEARGRPRERHLPENQARIEAALLAVLRDVTAGEVAAHGPGSGNGGVRQASITEEDGKTIWVERPVTSSDGQFAGRVDKAVKDDQLLALYDFKSSMLSDVPERYARQLQMYTEMWEATTGERPSKAVLVYPLQASEFAIDISPAATSAALQTSNEAVQPFKEYRPPETLAKPGDVCKICSFKPWCQPFWNWVTEGSLPLAQHRSVLGFQGEVKEVGRHKEFLMLKVAWHPRSTGTLLISWGLLPHAQALQPGQIIRVTGLRMTGQVTAPRAIWSAGAELYVVEL